MICGVDIDEPLSLPAGACLDIVQIHNRVGKLAWAVRCYGIADSFKDGRLFGRALPAWLGGSTMFCVALPPQAEKKTSDSESQPAEARATPAIALRVAR